MRIKLINPKSSEYTAVWPGAGVLYIAGETPKEFEVSYIDEMVEEINFEGNVDLIGITINFTSAAPRGYEIADIWRSMGAKVILGGKHVSFFPEEALTHADTVVIGEAEGTWQHVLADFKHHQLKKIYKSPSFVDLSKSVVPKFEILKPEKYFIPGVVEIARGCPYRCWHCSVSCFFGNKYRLKLLKKIIFEINEIKKTFPNKTIDGKIPVVFLEDNFFTNLQFAKELIKSLSPLDIIWYCQTTKCIPDEEIIKLAAGSGCFYLSLEAINLNSQKKIDHYRRCIEKLHEYNITVRASFLFGYDGDTEAIFENASEFIMQNEIEIPEVRMLVPYPGSRLYNKLRQEQRLNKKDWSEYCSNKFELVFKPKSLSEEVLRQGLRIIVEKIFLQQNIHKRLRNANSNYKWFIFQENKRMEGFFLNNLFGPQQQNILKEA